ncbi:MAG TPA: hypothetical protein DC049_03645, partial [Spirochaetia bacterium]|nr:hypothetical protein [Spirochaetia bacterium]
MPIELKDEHIDKLAHLIAGLFTEHFCSEKINFREFTEKFDDSVRIFQGKIKAKTPELWNARSVSAEGAVPRPYDLDYFLARGADMGSGEPDTKSLIPEEKIFINKDIFRQKLAGVKFSEISPAVENKLLSDLKEESIGMNEREIMIYFNLIKLEQLGADSPSGSSSAECSQNQCVKIL